MNEEYKKLYIEDYLNKMAKTYPQVINAETLQKAKDMFLNKSKPYIEIVEEINKVFQEMTEKEKQNIEVSDTELDTILSALSNDSLYSPKELLDKYKTESELQRIEVQQNELINKIRELRKENPALSKSDFYKLSLTSFLSPVVQKINEQYGNILPPHKLQKVNNLLNINNIVDYNELSKEEQQRYAVSDIQADSKLGKIIFNSNVINKATLEEEVAASMGALIHETFHLMINMQEGIEEENTRFFYKVATTDGVIETHFAPGKYGQVLSEGFVEKTSMDFAKRNGFYYTPNPSYVQYVNLANYIQKTNPSIDDKFLFSHNASETLTKLDKKQKEKIEVAERMVAFNHFNVKEIKLRPELKGIKSPNVIESYSEINDKKNIPVKNSNYKEPFRTQKQKNSFNQRSEREMEIYKLIKEKNLAIKNQKDLRQQFNNPKLKP